MPATLARHRRSPGSLRAYVGKKTSMRLTRAEDDDAGTIPHLRRGMEVLASGEAGILQLGRDGSRIPRSVEKSMGVKKTGKGRRKLGQKKRRMRARIRHRKG